MMSPASHHQRLSGNKRDNLALLAIRLSELFIFIRNFYERTCLIFLFYKNELEIVSLVV